VSGSQRRLPAPARIDIDPDRIWFASGATVGDHLRHLRREVCAHMLVDGEVLDVHDEIISPRGELES